MRLAPRAGVFFSSMLLCRYNRLLRQLAEIDRLHPDNTTICQPYLNDTVVEALSRLLDSRSIVRTINDSRRAGDVAILSQFINSVR